MQVKNNYDRLWQDGNGAAGTGVFNGDVGRITGIDGDEVSVDFEGRLSRYAGEDLAELEPAFAMTVHKAQGRRIPRGHPRGLPRRAATSHARRPLHGHHPRARASDPRGGGGRRRAHGEKRPAAAALQRAARPALLNNARPASAARDGGLSKQDLPSFLGKTGFRQAEARAAEPRGPLVSIG
jgi:hypothetical protein